MKTSNSKPDVSAIVEIANAFSGPAIVLICVIASPFILNQSDRANILSIALGSGSAMWQHYSRRETTNTEEGRGSGRFKDYEGYEETTKKSDTTIN